MDCFRERGPVVMTSGSNHANGGARAIIGMRSAAVRVLIMRTCAEIDHAHMRGNFRFLQGDGTANRVSSTVGGDSLTNLCFSGAGEKLGRWSSATCYVKLSESELVVIFQP